MRRLTLTLAPLALALTACGSTGTPQACLDALDAADGLMSNAAEASTIYSDVLGGPIKQALLAAFDHDINGLENATNNLEPYTARLIELADEAAASNYYALAEQCRNIKGR